MKYKKLFLHMGPGFNAYAERKLLQEKQSDVYFWDQPVIHQTDNTFFRLVDAASEQVQRLVRETGGPIEIVAHSFGGHIALEILRRHPQSVSHCEFYASGFDLATGFLNVLRRVYQEGDERLRQNMPPGTKELLQEKIGRREKFWDYIQGVVQDPNFMRFYWPNQKHFAKYNALVAQAPPLDFPTFQNVLSDLHKNWESRLSPVDWSGSVRMSYGLSDPLLTPSHEQSLWKKTLPQIEFCPVPGAGHLLHLEKQLD